MHVTDDTFAEKRNGSSECIYRVSIFDVHSFGYVVRDNY